MSSADPASGASSTAGTTEIRVEFLTGTFSGRSATADGHLPEWPPAPARLLQALVAAAGGNDTELDVLRALEAGPQPEIIAADRVHPRSTGHLTFYGPSRSMAATWPEDSNDQQTFLGRLQYGSMRHLSANPYSKAAPHVMDHVSDLADPTVIYRVPGLSTDQVAVLDQLAGKVAYLGRSRDMCMVTAALLPVNSGAADDDDLLAGRVLYRPVRDYRGPSGGRSKQPRRLQGWGTGLVDHLEHTHLLATTTVTPSRHPDHLLPWITYRRVWSATASSETVPIHFVPGLHAHHWNALVDTFPGSVPLYLPHRERAQIYGAVINAVGADGEVVTIPEVLRTMGQILPAYVEAESGESRWAWNTTRPSQDWTTVTPVTGSDNPTVVWAEIISRLMASTGLDHTEITVQLKPMPQADTDAAVSTHRRPGERLWHAEIHFAAPVTGPLCAGRDGLTGALVPAGHTATTTSGGRHG